jgi:hypothetical protein
MYEINQNEVPAAFMAIYCRNGRPFETRETIEARFEVCEALAHQVSALSLNLQHQTGLPLQDVLQQCVGALREPVELVSASEAEWLSGRLTELLENQ